MGFSAKKFKKTKFHDRTEAVPVPDLRAWFEDLPEKEVPAWTIKGLTGEDLGHVHETEKRNEGLGAILEKITAGTEKEKVEAVMQLLGFSKHMPSDVARRLEMLCRGSVDPECDMELAVKLCKNFPAEFYELTNKITLLTGQGHLPGELQGSGETLPSEQQ